VAGRLTVAFVVLAAVAAGPARAAKNPIEVLSSEMLSPRLTEFMLKTPALNFPAELRVLLPAGYDPKANKRYPVLYLLHGSFDDARSWTNKGAAEELTAGLDLIVVMPPTAGTGDAGGWASDWRNEGNFGPPMWETFTIRQLIPWVDARYRTIRRRAGRAIAGLSMGGFSTMSYAVRHPDLFVSAASYSGAVDSNYQPAWPIIQGEALADGGATPDAIWGPRASDEIYWRAHNPWDLAGNLRGMEVAIRTGNGTPGPHDSGGPPLDAIEYGVHDMSIALHDQLDTLKIAHVWNDYGPGTHTWPYWQDDLKADLPRFMATFANPPAAPRRFGYLSAEPVFSVYGWRVKMDREVTEFAEITDAGPRGFTLHGSGKASVRTARLYKPRSRHRVSVGGKAGELRADRSGRLTISVPLGTANSTQQYTAGSQTATYSTDVRIGR
jgi:S-formylglutathione hydrolase FrmB